MNLTKANLVLAIAAVVLSVPTWMTLRRDLENFVDVAEVPRLFAGFTPDNVATLALGKPKDPQPEVQVPPGTDPNQKPQVQYDQINFQRTDTGFVLGQGMGEQTGVPVNAQMLELQVWKHLAEIPADQETSVQDEATDAQLTEYGLDQAHAFVVRTANAQGQVLAELLVGKDTTTSAQGTETVRGVFVRRSDSRDVVFYEVPFWNRTIDTSQWIERTMFKVPADMVRRLELQNQTGKAVFTRAKGQGSWQSEVTPAGKGAIRQIEVEGLVQRFAYLQAADFVRPLASANAAQLGLESPALHLAVTYEKDGKDVTVTVDVGSVLDGKNTNYVRCSESNFVITVASPWVAGFERDVGEYYDPAAVQQDAPKDETPVEARKDEALLAPVVPREKEAMPEATPKPEAGTPGTGGGNEAPTTKPSTPQPAPVEPQPTEPKPAEPQPAQPVTPGTGGGNGGGSGSGG